MPDRSVTAPESFRTDEASARALDAANPLHHFRERFRIPTRDGSEVIYLAGNSLGLQPRSARALVDDEMDAWAGLGVDGHFKAEAPWYSYHALVREPTARIVGALPHEVVVMNSLTVNLHLMMVSFFRPTSKRDRILIEWPAFPSDLYAVTTHLRSRGLDPDETLLTIRPRAGEHTIRPEDLQALIETEGDSIALILLSGVNYFTGQRFDLERITALGRTRGCTVGFDLAHAAGNVELRLHDWDVDFACWCSYKYLNGGPGAVAGTFIHERHARNIDLPRYGGWWGNDPATRFMMHLAPQFVAAACADGWQLSNPPILALAPLRAALAIFDEAGMADLAAASRRLTGYLRFLVESRSCDWFEIITPAADDAHGCQLSILVHDRPRERFEALQSAGAVGDFREPNVIRVAPAPLYNTFEDVWRFASILGAQV